MTHDVEVFSNLRTEFDKNEITFEYFIEMADGLKESPKRLEVLEIVYDEYIYLLSNNHQYFINTEGYDALFKSSLQLIVMTPALFLSLTYTLSLLASDYTDKSNNINKTMLNGRGKSSNIMIASIVGIAFISSLLVILVQYFAVSKYYTMGHFSASMKQVNLLYPDISIGLYQFFRLLKFTLASSLVSLICAVINIYFTQFLAMMVSLLTIVCLYMTFNNSIVFIVLSVLTISMSIILIKKFYAT